MGSVITLLWQSSPPLHALHVLYLLPSEALSFLGAPVPVPSPATRGPAGTSLAGLGTEWHRSRARVQLFQPGKTTLRVFRGK